MLRRLSRSLEGDFGRLVAPRFAQDLAPQLERVGMRLEREGTVQRQQRAVFVTELVGRIAELVPDEREVGVDFHRALQLAECFPIASELREGRAPQRVRETGLTESAARAVG